MAKLTKEEKVKEAKKSEILDKYKINMSEGKRRILDKLWDSEGQFSEGKISEVIDEIRLLQRRNKKEFKKLIETTRNYMDGFGLEEDISYSLHALRDGKMAFPDSWLTVTLRLKGNKKIIEHLEDKGWVLDRYYRNDNGSTSIWDTDFHADHSFHSMVMVVMKYKVDEIFVKI